MVLSPGRIRIFCRIASYSSGGISCLRPPWTFLVNIDLNNPRVLWSVPYGYVPGLDPQWGTILLTGGLIITGGGLIFGAGTADCNLWVINSQTGVTEFSVPIGMLTGSMPITYRVNDRQFVVLNAGNESNAVFAFSIPPQQESNFDYFGSLMVIFMFIGIVVLLFKI